MTATPLATKLFVVELKVVDWPGAVRWYEETLGLTLLLRDAAHSFALLGAGPARVGLKQATQSESAARPFRLVFQVDDLEAAEVHLRARGVKVGPPSYNEDEGYGEIRLTDPEGTPITLFQWLRSPGRF
ncbi:MAG: VOC family protein [Isosphaeraceae bacterium]|nr:VOC family protein [Isosphaeraceae bacterium]